MYQTSWSRENKSPLMAIYTIEILAIKAIKIKDEKVQKKIKFEKSWAHGVMNSHVPVTFLQELWSHGSVLRYNLGLIGRHLSVKFVTYRFDPWVSRLLKFLIIMSLLYQFVENEIHISFWKLSISNSTFSFPLCWLSCDKFTFCNIAWWIKDVSWSLAKCSLNWSLDVIMG